jgi:hypothetical protein
VFVLFALVTVAELFSWDLVVGVERFGDRTDETLRDMEEWLLRDWGR